VITEVVVWLCRSPRRLAVAAVGVLAVLLVGGSVLFGTGANGNSGTTSGSGSVSATTSAAAVVPDANAPVKAALAFVRAWSQLKPGETSTQWQAALVPLSTPHLSAALRTTDTARLPGVPPAGEPVVHSLSQTSALISVPLSDGSSVLVTVVPGDSGQLVSDIQPNEGDD